MKIQYKGIQVVLSRKEVSQLIVKAIKEEAGVQDTLIVKWPISFENIIVESTSFSPQEEKKREVKKKGFKRPNRGIGQAVQEILALYEIGEEFEPREYLQGDADGIHGNLIEVFPRLTIKDFVDFIAHPRINPEHQNHTPRALARKGVVVGKRPYKVRVEEA